MGVIDCQTAATAARSNQNEQLRQACREFEAFFWHQLLRVMRETIPNSGFIGDTYQQAVYEDLLDEQYSLLLAEKSATGISEILYRQLLSSYGGNIEKSNSIEAIC